MLEIRKPSIASLQDSRSAYDAIYAERGIRQLDSFYAWLLRLLRPEEGKKLLDVSCGEGHLLRIGARYGLGLYGLDISDAAISIARQNIPSAELAVGDAEDLPFPDDCFDYVTNIGSLEHYLHPDKGVREMARILKRAGKACILLPNSFGLTWNILSVWRTGDISDDGQPIQRYATRKEWQELLEGNGLSVYKTLKYEREFPRTIGDAWWYIRHPKKLLHLALSPLIPLNLASCFVFLCRKATKRERLDEE